MSALLTCSDVPLPMETVPAVKIVHFNGEPKADKVYAYARLYSLNGSLCFSLTRFEQAPSATAKMGIVVANIDNASRFLFLNVSFKGESDLCIYESEKPIKQLLPIKLHITSGTDEQGWYFSAQGELSSSVLGTVNVILQPKNVFLSNIYSYDTTESAFGAAYKTPVLNSIPTIKGVEPIVCVSY